MQKHTSKRSVAFVTVMQNTTEEIFCKILVKFNVCSHQMYQLRSILSNWLWQVSLTYYFIDSIITNKSSRWEGFILF